MRSLPHILVVDDHREIRDLLARFLVKYDLRVTVAADGKAMRQVMEAASIDLVVLDLMLPGEDGLSLCRWMRSAHPEVPIVMLTAMGEETDRVVGLEMGADDYVAKPFSARELLARIRAVLRRAQTVAGGAAAGAGDGGVTYRFAGWRLDAQRRELVGADGVAVPLSSGEYEMLLAFVQHPNRVLSRDQLLDLARGRSAVPFDRSVDTQVSRLRRKLEPDQAEPVLIKTVWGEGYVLAAPVSIE